jgi:hypothetical protein
MKSDITTLVLRNPSHVEQLPKTSAIAIRASL